MFKKVKKVRCINQLLSTYGDFTYGKEYEVVRNLWREYCVINDAGSRNYVNKSHFEVIK